MTVSEKVVKFHGTEVANVTILYAIRSRSKPNSAMLEEFDAVKNPEICETINIQIVSDYITITFYKEESRNSMIRRELIPTHTVQHIWVKDLTPREQVMRDDHIDAIQIAVELQKEERELEQIEADPEQILEEQEKIHARSSQE
ncbi:hypothetical protein BH18THE2_BH18THE2_19800 [soil metagenome]